MTQNKSNLYEGMYIISAKLSDDARSKALDKIKHGIESHGGEIHIVHDWGRRRLAYEIDGHREGHYYIMYFNVKPSAIIELWQEGQLNEDLVRLLTLRADKIKEKIEFKTLIEEN